MATLRRLSVEGLFEREPISIDLDRGSTTPVGDSRLTLLYGRNGSGKSTLLRLLHHGLSRDQRAGHRSAIAQLPFQTATFYFADGEEVTYTRRRRGTRVTALDVRVALADGSSRVESWKVDFRGIIDPDKIGAAGARVTQGDSERDVPESEQTALPTVAEMLESLTLDPVIITDSHQIFSDLIDDDDEQDDEERVVVARRAQSIDKLVNQRRDKDLASALDRVSAYLNAMVADASREGAGEVDRIYEGVVSSLVATAPAPGRPRQYILPALRSRLKKLSSQADPLLSYGLVGKPSFESIDAALLAAPDRIGPQLRSVLAPYFDGLALRYEAMHPAFRAIDVYVRTINSFLEHKHLQFDNGGLLILDDYSNLPIEAQDLSSGEKQLLVLFSYLVSLREDTRLFIIDEPEISLNPDWQRKLVPLLLRCLEADSRVQLVIATHSIEILAPHDDQVQFIGAAREPE